MTLKDFIVAWDRSFYYDYWWRQKYHVAFNSEQHRSANQINIAMEYLENNVANVDIKKIMDEQERIKALKQFGWEKVNKDKEKEFFDNLDLDQFD